MSLRMMLRRLCGTSHEYKGDETKDGLDLPSDNYSTVSAIIVHQDEIDAYRQLLRRDRGVSMYDSELVRQIVQDALRSYHMDTHEELTTKVEEILDIWEPEDGENETIAFVNSPSRVCIGGFYIHCMERDEMEADQFELTENDSTAESFYQKIWNTDNSDSSVVVAAPKKYIPDVQW